MVRVATKVIAFSQLGGIRKTNVRQGDVDLDLYGKLNVQVFEYCTCVVLRLKPSVAGFLKFPHNSI
jgi:hypothetical protein